MTLFTRVIFILNSIPKTCNRYFSLLGLLTSFRYDARHTQQIATLACSEPTIINLGFVCSALPIHRLLPFVSTLLKCKNLLDLLTRGAKLHQHFCRLLADQPTSQLWHGFSVLQDHPLWSSNHSNDLDYFLYLPWVCFFFHKTCPLSTSLPNWPISTSTSWVLAVSSDSTIL